MNQYSFARAVAILVVLGLGAAGLQRYVDEQRVVYLDPLTKECVGIKEGREIVGSTGCYKVTEEYKEVVLPTSSRMKDYRK